MDLSSLEGPPITDSRFSSPAPSTFSVPHIRLEDTFSPVSPVEPSTWDLPPRPASTSAIPPRSKYPSTNTGGFYQTLHPNNTERRFRTPPNQSPNPGVSQVVSHFTTTTTLSPTPRSSRPHSNSVSTPHQLVWVESEQIWILTTRTATPAQEPTQRPQSSRSNPGTSLAGAFSHPRSMGLYSSMDYALDVDPGDLPPPYEAHIFDRPLGPIPPAVTRVRPQEPPAPRRSRWDAIGRRVS
ncbi:uncharacterized protein BDV17DRAFT_286499 [Aspergillus undulatus]|uniref:uncharacterized protein n=1 Tax=Aspergillus undulatus TaxID=1810928 RepID=UPI003CCE0A36